MRANWYKWQRDAARYVATHTSGGDVITIKSPRQCGKTYWLSTMATWYGESHKGSEIMIVAPTWKQVKKIAKALYKQYLVKIRKFNQSDLTIELRNGSIIRCMSGKQGENLRGYTNDIIFVDEGAYIPDEIYEILLPTIQKKCGVMVITSTPNFAYGFYYDNYIRGGGNTFDWCKYDLSGVLTDTIKAKFKKIFTVPRYRTEILGEFMVNLSPVFGDFSAVMTNERGAYNDVVLGVDWGTGVGGDYTAIVGFNGDKHMCVLDYWNDRNEFDTIESIVDYCRQTHARQICVEKNSIGSVFLAYLRKAIADAGLQISVNVFITTNLSKKRIIDKIVMHIERRAITILNDIELEKQMNHFVCTINTNMVKSYAADKNFHDDIIMAMGIALNATATGYRVL